MFNIPITEIVVKDSSTYIFIYVLDYRSLTQLQPLFDTKWYICTDSLFRLSRIYYLLLYKDKPKSHKGAL